MSAERDLLNKALAVLLELKDCSDLWCEYYVPIGIHYRIDEAIQELLAQPEQEPEAWILEDKKTGYRRQSVYKPTDLDEETCNVIPLYTAPPKREPLSEDKLDVLAEANITDEGIAGYYLGFRDAEKYHNIGEQK